MSVLLAGGWADVTIISASVTGVEHVTGALQNKAYSLQNNFSGIFELMAAYLHGCSLEDGVYIAWSTIFILYFSSIFSL